MDIVFNAGWELVLDEVSSRMLEKIAADVETDAKSACPVKSGRLRDSIDHRMEAPDHAVVFSDVPYAAFVEEGTRHMPAEPYLRPALYKQRDA